MRITWHKSIMAHNMWEPECFGLFYKFKDIVTFFYKYRSCLMKITEISDTPEMLLFDETHNTISLPYNWTFIEENGETLLMTNRKAGFDLNQNIFTYHIPVSVQDAYLKQVQPEKHLEEAKFFFGDYTISHKGNCGYACTMNGQEIWEFTGKAYLYTDIICWKDRLFFGTSGHGGYFYVLDLETGKPIVSIKTGGTRSIIHVDNLCYVLSNEKTAQLLCVDLSNGKTVAQCTLHGKATDHSRIAIFENHIHAITYKYSKGMLKQAIWSCVEF